MRLVLVRHAEAGPGSPDELRTLTAVGYGQARQLGDKLRADGVEPDAVLTSPLLRARETGAALGFAEAEAVDQLAPGATEEDVRAGTFAYPEHHATSAAVSARTPTGPPVSTS